MTALALTHAHEDLVAAYGSDLDAAGLQVDHAWLWGGRAFCVRYGNGDTWNAAPLEERLACNVRIHRFVIWMIASGRMTTTPDYLLARRSHLATAVARHQPALHQRLVTTATDLGFSEVEIQRQWRARAWVYALTGLPSDTITQAATLGRQTNRELRSGLFGLCPSRTKGPRWPNCGAR